MEEQYTLLDVIEIGNHINGLIYMETMPDEEYNLDYPYFKPSRGMITFYVIPSHLLKTLDEYSNDEIENSFINKFNHLYNNTLLYKIIQIACHDKNLFFLDYLKNRGIKLNNNSLNITILNCIYHILTTKINFDIIQYLIEYGISVSNTEILFMYITHIHYRILDNESLLDEKEMHLNNIKYLMNIGVDLNYRNETESYTYYSIKEMIEQIDYARELYWIIRKDFLMFIEGTQINIHNESNINVNINVNINEHICKYIGNDLIVKEVLSYI